jgi:subtilisin family serine protease
MPDFLLDLHSEDKDIPDVSRIGPIVGSDVVNADYNYTGKGVRVAIIDTGVDFSNPDIQHSLARDKNNHPIMLDADGQGIILTNATFIANINEDGILRNFTKQIPDNITSTVYKTKKGVFLNIVQGGNNTKLLVYNSFFPQNGPSPVFNGTLSDDMKIGDNNRDYIVSKSGVYHLGVMYQGALSGPYTRLQTVPVLVVDSAEPGVYDTIIPDLSTSWEDYTRFELPKGEKPNYDYDFTDETPIKLGSGNEFLIYDYDDDGKFDFSAGTVGAQVVDIYGVVKNQKSVIDKTLKAINGTLLPALDPDGEFFGVMTDFVGHGTSTAASITSRGAQEYDIYNNTEKYLIRGVAPDAKIIPVKALWFGDSAYASLWSAGFDSNENKWEFSGVPRVDIMSNSWGVSNFPSLNVAPGLDLLSLIQSMLVTPRSLDPNYPGVVVISSAGNSGPGYGTIGLPNAAPFGISVGATTNNVFVGYGPFQDQPRFGNTTDYANQVVDFSSRGPGIIGDPKPELMSIGAHSFTPAQVTKLEKESKKEPFSMFGGTSMAAPLVSGSAALLIQSLQENSQDYDPFRVKNILISTATDIQNDPFTQGAGLVNATNAIKFVLKENGSLIVYNDESYSNLKQILDVPITAINSTYFGIDRFLLPSANFPQTTWFGGHLLPGERSTTTFTIENPSSEPLEISVMPEKLELIKKNVFDGQTIPRQQDPILNKSGTYAPNYIRLADVKEYNSLATYFDDTKPIPDDASLMILNVNFPFDNFMNKTDAIFANDIKISSLYLYDWMDKNNETLISSDELSLVNRAGSWGTVQEMRISDPNSQFEDTPLVGVYPVPSRYSYWLGDTKQNSTSIDYDLSASYYKKDRWDVIWLDNSLLEIPPNSSAEVTATIVVPTNFQTGAYQGFLKFKGDKQTVNVPVTFGVKEIIRNDELVFVSGKQSEDVIYGNGYFKGAFDMVNRYMAGDWRQFYFDIDNSSINTGVLDISWEDPDTNLSVFAIDPQGRIVQTNVPPGVFGKFMDWPTSDWLGTTPFSQGGGFFPVKNKDLTSSGLYLPINQTGTYTILTHSGLFGGNSTTEQITIAAKFTNLPQPDEYENILKEPPIILKETTSKQKQFPENPNLSEKNTKIVNEIKSPNDDTRSNTESSFKIALGS